MTTQFSMTGGRLAFIPARGGSKRIPRKNIKNFVGRPMITWPIRAALDSKAFSKVLVSTDDSEIAKVSSECGAEVIFRNPQLSDDFTHTTPVLQDFLRNAINPDEDPWVYKIYPGTPARPQDLEDFVTFTELVSSGLTVSVTKSRNPVQRALVMSTENLLSFREPQFALTRTQDLQSVYYDVGKMYGGRKSDWLRTDSPLLGSARGFELPDWLAVDLDTFEDWEFAEYKFRREFDRIDQ